MMGIGIPKKSKSSDRIRGSLVESKRISGALEFIALSATIDSCKACSEGTHKQADE